MENVTTLSLSPLEQLTAFLQQAPFLLDLLDCVHQYGPPGAWIGAGAVRAAVWNRLHGLPPTHGVSDIDVIWMQDGPWDPTVEQHFAQQLHHHRPSWRWDVCNQAWVHHWYPDRFGQTISPIRSVKDGVAGWPETATCVAVRRTADPGAPLEYIAPYGLSDLFEMVLRPTPGRTDAFHTRLAQKRFLERWPNVRVTPLQ